MDGLIIDSEPFWRASEIEVFKTVGVHLTDEDCRHTTGFRFDEVVAYWFARQPWTDKTATEIEEDVIAKMENHILYEAEPMEGLYDSLRYFSGKNVSIALASSSPLRLIKATVSKLEIGKYFSAILSAETETYGKPHPAVFLSTANALGVKPENCLVLEDSLNGVIAAKAARMKCAAIPLAENRQDPRFAIADYRFDNLKQVAELL